MVPEHGSPGRYRGSASREPCRCTTCVLAQQAARRAEKDKAKYPKPAKVLSDSTFAAPDLALPSLKGPGVVELAVITDIEKAGLTGTGLAALARALAHEIDFPDERAVSIAGPAGKLRDVLADIHKGGVSGDSEFDKLLAELQSGPAVVPAAVRDSAPA